MTLREYQFTVYSFEVPTKSRDEAFQVETQIPEKKVVKNGRGGVCKMASAFRLPSGIFTFFNWIVAWLVCFCACYIAIIL